MLAPLSRQQAQSAVDTVMAAFKNQIQQIAEDDDEKKEILEHYLGQLEASKIDLDGLEDNVLLILKIEVQNLSGLVGGVVEITL